MDRREVVVWLASAAGLTLVDGLSPAEVLGLGRTIHARSTTPAAVLDAHQRATLVAAAERIIPGGDTPGATDADVASFIERILADWYSVAERDRFISGLTDLDARSRARHNREFAECGEADQHTILGAIDDEVVAQRRRDAAAANNHPFAMLKYMTVWGYCTSEVAMRTYGDYPPPMRYDGCAVVAEVGASPARG